MKAVLDRQADAHGHTQSQEAVRLINLGLLMDAGSPAVTDALQAMVKAAGDVHVDVGDPTASVPARDELRRRWRIIADAAIPHVAESAASSAAKAAISAMRFAAIAAREEVSRVEPSSASLEVAKKHLGQMNVGSPSLLFPGVPAWPQAKADIQAAADKHGGAVAEALTLLLSMASAAERAVARAERPTQ